MASDEYDFGAYDDVWESATHGEGDEFAAFLFERGFTDNEIPYEEREAMRASFFDWMEEHGYDPEEDFDWDAWREAYDSA